MDVRFEKKNSLVAFTVEIKKERNHPGLSQFPRVDTRSCCSFVAEPITLIKDIRSLVILTQTQERG